MRAIMRALAVGAIALWGVTAAAAAKPQDDFKTDTHRLDRGWDDGLAHSRHRDDREHDQIEAFRHVWRRTGAFALSCGHYAWNAVFHSGRFHHHRDGQVPPGTGAPPAPDKPHDDKTDQPAPMPIPEPGSLSILLSALLLTAWLIRRRNRNA